MCASCFPFEIQQSWGRTHRHWVRVEWPVVSEHLFVSLCTNLAVLTTLPAKPTMGSWSENHIVSSKPGIYFRRMDMQFDSCHGTTFLDFENVKVPRSNLIGEEGPVLVMMSTVGVVWSWEISETFDSRLSTQFTVRFGFQLRLKLSVALGATHRGIGNIKLILCLGLVC